MRGVYSALALGLCLVTAASIFAQEGAVRTAPGQTVSTAAQRATQEELDPEASLQVIRERIATVSADLERELAQALGKELPAEAKRAPESDNHAAPAAEEPPLLPKPTASMTEAPAEERVLDQQAVTSKTTVAKQTAQSPRAALPITTPTRPSEPGRATQQALQEEGYRAAQEVQRVLRARQQYRVHAFFDGQAIVVEGPVRRAADLGPPLRLAQRFGYPVVNRLSVYQPRPPVAHQMASPVQEHSMPRRPQQQTRINTPDLLDILFTPQLVDWRHVFGRQ